MSAGGTNPTTFITCTSLRLWKTACKSAAVKTLTFNVRIVVVHSLDVLQDCRRYALETVVENVEEVLDVITNLRPECLEASKVFIELVDGIVLG